MPRLLTAFALALATPASAQTPLPPIPVAADVKAAGTMTVDVDATDTRRGILRVRQTVPVAGPGPLVLLYPEWITGNHAPRGQIEKLAGLVIRAGGQTLAWTRDPVNVHAFHVTVPQGARTLELAFQFVSATEADQGRVVVTEAMMNLQWQSLTLYPAGIYTRNLPVTPRVTYPPQWKAGTALRPAETNGDTVRYQTVDYETLVDSPIFAGRHFRAEPLGNNVTLNIVADEAKYLAATPGQIAAHRRLVDQAVKLFGTRSWDHYDFLLALTDEMGAIGVEHHRSSENGVNPEYLTEWDAGPGRRNLLPHELAHSWVGKHRRPKGHDVKDFATPLVNDLMWVYEGQDQLWGYVLGARSGIFSKQETLDALASILAALDARKGREWRSVADTTRDPVITARRPKGWVSWQRSEDYYNEGLSIWLEADTLIRGKTGGRKGLDDFASAFFGTKDGDWSVKFFDLDEVVATLNGVAAHDWARFLADRVSANGVRPAADVLAGTSYRLAWSEEATPFYRDAEKRAGEVNLTFSLGMIVGKGGHLTQVIWDGPAFNAGLTTAAEIVAVDGRTYSETALREAVTAAKGGREPIRLIVKTGTRVREVAIPWTGGHRYPRLEKTTNGEGNLDRLLAPRP
jgi:predicted metalloprotease with PDZ domain